MLSFDQWSVGFQKVQRLVPTPVLQILSFRQLGTGGAGGGGKALRFNYNTQEGGLSSKMAAEPGQAMRAFFYSGISHV